MISRTRIYDFVHKIVVLGLLGGSVVGMYMIYSEINRLKKLKAKEISERESGSQLKSE